MYTKWNLPVKLKNSFVTQAVYFTTENLGFTLKKRRLDGTLFGCGNIMKPRLGLHALNICSTAENCNGVWFQMVFAKYLHGKGSYCGCLIKRAQTGQLEHQRFEFGTGIQQNNNILAIT